MSSNWKLGIVIVICIVVGSIENGVDWWTVVGVGAGMALIGTSIGENHDQT